MFNYVMPRVGAKLIQIRWLFLEGVNTCRINVTTMSHIGIPPTAAVFYGNKTTSSPRKLSTSSIPAPTRPHQYDAHIRAYRKHEAAKHEAATTERLTAHMVLHASLKIWAPCPKTTTRWSPQRVGDVPNHRTTSYIVKLPRKDRGTPVSSAAQIEATNQLNTTRA